MRCLRMSSQAASFETTKAVPTQAPRAPRQSAAARPRPSPMPPAASTGLGATASTTCGTSAIVPTRPVWPPASAPCATTTSVPPSATRRAFFTFPTRAITLTPAAWNSSTYGAGLPRPEANTGTFSARIVSIWERVKPGPKTAPPRRPARRAGARRAPPRRGLRGGGGGGEAGAEARPPAGAGRRRVLRLLVRQVELAAEVGGELALGGGQHVAPVLGDLALALRRAADGCAGRLGDRAHRGQKDVHPERLVGQLADLADLLAQLVRPHGC